MATGQISRHEGLNTRQGLAEEGTASPLPISAPLHQLRSMGTVFSLSGVQGEAQLPKGFTLLSAPRMTSPV